jgi:hypothetical protein|tara:strand:+ start:272 stop:535 length:264 start_codon:yes stop_codon:yes gene_type:complete
MINHQKYARAYISDLTNKGDSPTHELLKMSHELTSESQALSELINAAKVVVSQLNDVAIPPQMQEAAERLHTAIHSKNYFPPHIKKV